MQVYLHYISEIVWFSSFSAKLTRFRTIRTIFLEVPSMEPNPRLEWSSPSPPTARCMSRSPHTDGRSGRDAARPTGHSPSARRAVGAGGPAPCPPPRSHPPCAPLHHTSPAPGPCFESTRSAFFDHSIQSSSCMMPACRTRNWTCFSRPMSGSEKSRFAILR